MRSDIEAASIDEQLIEWVQQHQAAIVNAGPNPFSAPTKWGVATTRGNRLFLHITARTKTGKLVIPRLHNSVASCKFMLMDEQLKLTPNVSAWEIAIPKKQRTRSRFPRIVELELDRPPLLGQDEPPVVKPSEDKVLRLHARCAMTHGQMLRFEPQAHKNTVGYWTMKDDWVEWAFEPDPNKTYEIVLRYGCGEGQGGSEIDVSVGKTRLPFEVAVTGGFQTWREVNLGSVSGLQAVEKLSVKARRKAKNAVMDIQEIMLKPVSE